MKTLDQYLTECANAIATHLGRPVRLNVDEGCPGGFFLVVPAVQNLEEAQKIYMSLGVNPRYISWPPDQHKPSDLHIHLSEVDGLPNH